MRIVMSGNATVNVEDEVVRRVLVQHLLDGAKLSVRERKVVDMKLADADFDDIAKVFQVTSYRIKEIHRKALVKLRKYSRRLAKQARILTHINRLKAEGR